MSYLKLACWLAADENGTIWFHTEKPVLKWGKHVSKGDFCIAYDDDLPEEFRHLSVEDGPKRIEIVATDFQIRKV